MMHSDTVQQLIIGAIVLVSALHVLRRLLPKWMHARQQSLAALLDRPQRPAALRALGRWLHPGEQAGGGCGSGCNTCSTCESNPEADGKADKTETDIKPLKFHRHVRADR